MAIGFGSFYVETVPGCTWKLSFNRQTKCHTGMLAHHLETEHLMKLPRIETAMPMRVITMTLTITEDTTILTDNQQNLTERSSPLSQFQWCQCRHCWYGWWYSRQCWCFYRNLPLWFILPFLRLLVREWFFFGIFAVVLFFFAVVVLFYEQSPWLVLFFSKTMRTWLTKDICRPSYFHALILHTVFVSRVVALEERIDFPSCTSNYSLVQTDSLLNVSASGQLWPT